MADHLEDLKHSRREILGQLDIWQQQAVRYNEIVTVLTRLKCRGVESHRFKEVIAAHGDLITVYSQRAGEAGRVAAKISQTLADLAMVMKRLADEEEARIRALTRPRRPGTAPNRP